MKSERNILIVFIMNIIFTIIEFIGGIITNSVAIISDSIHDLGDSISIGLSYLFEKKSKQKPDDIYTYGYARYSLLGSVITTTLLIIGSILVLYSATKRIIYPKEINYNEMILLAIIGIIINLVASYFTKEGESLNQKSVNLHMLEDVLGWIIVLIGAILMRFTDIKIIDSILSIIVATFILINSILNLKKIINIFLEKKPNNISIDEIKETLLKIKDIKDIHHIHIWSLDGYNNYATMHIVTSNIKIKKEIKKELKKFGISHTTIEIETPKELCNEENCVIDNKIKHIHNHKKNP